ncbi:MAG: hypothetical protein FWE90_07665 [Defluviitaleaceae bacterium]|nr:hypothetical protein [Defluviitaleaceae bacterium]
MGAFELQTAEPEESFAGQGHKRIKDECIVAYKVYDSCRRQNCLTYKDLGPPLVARYAEEHNECMKPDTPVKPPEGSASVSIDKLTITRINVLNKQPSPFRAGYWDVDVKFEFEYVLVFRCASGEIINEIRAKSFFKMKTTLFGSLGSDLVIGTDLYIGKTNTFQAAPFIWVEAKAVALDARLCHGHGRPPEIHLTIGLFAILKLFRLVHLNVQSTGFCIPEACKESNDINPCEYFADLEFPMDIFSPPQKPDFKPCN